MVKSNTPEENIWAKVCLARTLVREAQVFGSNPSLRSLKDGFGLWLEGQKQQVRSDLKLEEPLEAWLEPIRGELQGG